MVNQMRNQQRNRTIKKNLINAVRLRSTTKIKILLHEIDKTKQEAAKENGELEDRSVESI